MKALNEKIAVWITNHVGTMGCVWLFLVWSLLPLVFPSLQEAVFYVSGGILQLVLLPLIMVGQSIQGRTAELRAQQDHETLMKEFALQKSELTELRILNHQIHALLEEEGILYAYTEESNE